MPCLEGAEFTSSTTKSFMEYGRELRRHSMETNSEDRPIMVQQTAKQDHTGAFIAVFVILALLIIGEIYSLGRFSSLRSELMTQQSKMNHQLGAEVANKIQDLQNANSQALDQLRSELDSTAT